MAMNFKKDAPAKGKGKSKATEPKEEAEVKEEKQVEAPQETEPDTPPEEVLNDPDASWEDKFQAVQAACETITEFGQALKGVQIQTMVENSADGEVEVLENDSQVLPLKVATPSSEVGGSLGTTVNTGDYNSLRFSAHIKVPCAVGNEDAAMDLLEGWLSERVEGMYAKYVGDDE